MKYNKYITFLLITLGIIVLAIGLFNPYTGDAGNMLSSLLFFFSTKSILVWLLYELFKYQAFFKNCNFV